MGKYHMRYFFEYGGSCLWSMNEAARERFGYCVDLDQLPVSAATRRTAVGIGEWFWGSLNPDYPPDPGPWRQTQCDRFNQATADLLAVLRRELGPDFEIVDQQKPMTEDPDLDAYLADPKGFRR